MLSIIRQQRVSRVESDSISNAPGTGPMLAFDMRCDTPRLYEYEMGRRVSSHVYTQYKIIDPEELGVPSEKTMTVDQLEICV